MRNLIRGLAALLALLAAPAGAQTPQQYQSGNTYLFAIPAVQSGSLTDASASIGTSATTVLSACAAGAAATPATGCGNNLGRTVLIIVNQGNISGATGNLCVNFGAPPSCTAGSGSLILPPGTGWQFDPNTAPPDDVRLMASSGTVPALVKSR